MLSDSWIDPEYCFIPGPIFEMRESEELMDFFHFLHSCRLVVIAKTSSCETKLVTRLLKLDRRQAEILIVWFLMSVKWPVLRCISALLKVDRYIGK